MSDLGCAIAKVVGYSRGPGVEFVVEKGETIGIVSLQLLVFPVEVDDGPSTTAAQQGRRVTTP